MGVGSLHLRVVWPWDTGVLAVPAGWSIDTNFNDRFLQGDDETFTGSANTDNGDHTHGDTTNGGAGHTHTGIAHNHTFSAGATSFPPSTSIAPGSASSVSRANHSHNSATSASTQITYSTDTISITAADMLPPYVKATILKPDDIGQDIPDDGVCFTDEATAPTGFHACDGGGGTVDFNNRYILSTNAGADGGDLGGATTHDHGGSTSNHNHTPDDHVHPGTACGASTSTIGAGAAAGVRSTGLSNHHTVTLTSKTLNDLGNSSSTVGSASNDPAYVKLLGIQNTSGAATLASGVILPFVGAVADIPHPWILCDGTGDSNVDCRDKQIKLCATTGSIGDTGGSNTHGHTIGSHTHTHTAGHNHSTSVSVDGTTRDSGINFVLSTASAHTHSWTVNTTQPSTGNEDTAITVDSTVDARYNYRTVVFVKYAPGATTLWIKGKTKILGKTLLAG